MQRKPEERLEVRLHPAVRDLLIDRADAEGLPVAEVAYIAICRLLGVDPKEYPIPRGRAGRPIKKRQAKS